MLELCDGSGQSPGCDEPVQLRGLAARSGQLAAVAGETTRRGGQRVVVSVDRGDERPEPLPRACGVQTVVCRHEGEDTAVEIGEQRVLPAETARDRLPEVELLARLPCRPGGAQ